MLIRVWLEEKGTNKHPNDFTLVLPHSSCAVEKSTFLDKSSVSAVTYCAYFKGVLVKIKTDVCKSSGNLKSTNSRCYLLI
jgi:hypothetical protein